MVRSLLVLASALVFSTASADTLPEKLIFAARERTTHHEIYDGSYRRIGYPMGDVPNLQRFFERAGGKLAVSRDPADYAAGDLVTWMLPGNLPHIGIVSDRRVDGSSRPKILHNIGAGPVEDDILFAHPITGHYRYPAGTRPTTN